MSSGTGSSPPQSGNGVVVANPVAALQNSGTRAVARTRAAFASKPWQTSAVFLSAFSLFLHIICTWSPWWSYYALQPADGGVPESAIYGSISPYEARWCYVSEGTPADDSNAKTCAYVQLPDVAKDVSYLQTAGGVVLAFTILSVPLSMLAAYLTYLRRIGGLWRVPERFGGLRNWYWTVALHASTAGFLLIAFASYAGIMSSSWNADKAAVPLGYGSSQILKSSGLTGGFGCAIVAFLFSVAAAGVTAVHKEEISRTGVPEGPEGETVQTAVAGAYADVPEWSRGKSFAPGTAKAANLSAALDAAANEAAGLPPAMPAAQFRPVGVPPPPGAPPLPPRAAALPGSVPAEGVDGGDTITVRI